MSALEAGSEAHRLALRRDALRVARLRGNVRDGSWAGSRARLFGVDLDPADFRFARESRARFGRALRRARSRNETHIDEVTTQPRTKAARSRRRAIALALAAVALITALVVLLMRTTSLEEQIVGGGTPVAGGVAATASPLRGRTDVIVPVVIVVTPTPAPTPEPSSTPAATVAATGRPGGTTGGTGSGGSGGGQGGGIGSGVGTGTASPRPTATPTLAPVPTDTPDPSNTMIWRGRVVDARTGKGVPNVCVAPGLNTCIGQTVRYTDADGYWELVLSIGQQWDIKFLKTGYFLSQIRVPSQPGIHQVSPDTQLRPVP